ncbi:MAG: hypothetical protein QM484_02230 [Woeseiaceae bacterium]
MRKIEEIEQDIQKLNNNELRSFRQWFSNFDNKQWDNQLQEDVANGKLDSMADEAIEQFRTGKAKKL